LVCVRIASAAPDNSIIRQHIHRFCNKIFFILNMRYHKLDSSVGTAMSYGLESQVWVLEEARSFFLFKQAPIPAAGRSRPLFNGTGDFSGDKAVGAWTWSLTWI
jgi:hypothetical protein